MRPSFPLSYSPTPARQSNLRVFLDTGAGELALFENRTGAIPGTQVVGQETRTTIRGKVVVKTVEFHELTLGTAHWARRAAR